MMEAPTNIFDIDATQKRADIAAGGQQRGGLRLDAAHVLIDGGVVAVSDGLLPNLTGANVHHRASQDGDDFRRVRERSLLIRFGEVEVADHDRRLVTKLGRNCRPAAPYLGTVDDIVMDERGRMRELNRNRGGRQPLQVIASALRGEEHERRADSLPARRDEISHRARDDIGVVLDQEPQALLDGFQVSRDWTEDGVRLCL